MSGPIGHTFLYNIIILFILIVFAFLMGTVSYYKAFKVNNRIVHAIEKFEGYNECTRTPGNSKKEVDCAKGEIEQVLQTFGYRIKETGKRCPDTYKKGAYRLISLKENYNYCIYISTSYPTSGSYYTYGVLTYMNLDLPIISEIDIPVFTRTNQIYKFTNTIPQGSIER